MARRLTVFFVDDDEDMLATIVPELEAVGHYVLPARNGHEALSRMRGTLAPRIAVIDLVMPEMDGAQLIAAITQDPQLADIPIIVSTGDARTSVPGAAAVLRKPYKLDRLIEAIDTATATSSDELTPVMSAVPARRR